MGGCNNLFLSSLQNIYVMLANETIPAVLNEQQVMMLRLLKKPLPEEDFKMMQRLAVQLLSKQLDEQMGNWEEEKNITTESYDSLLNNHFRSSTNNQ